MQSESARPWDGKKAQPAVTISPFRLAAQPSCGMIGVFSHGQNGRTRLAVYCLQISGLRDPGHSMVHCELITKDMGTNSVESVTMRSMEKDIELWGVRLCPKRGARLLRALGGRRRVLPSATRLTASDTATPLYSSVPSFCPIEPLIIISDNARGPRRRTNLESMPFKY